MSAARRMAGRFVDRLGGAAIEPHGQAYPAARVVPERCRVRIDLAAVARQVEPSLAKLSAPTRAAFSRWARALTWRRVGVALGGSGAWGYALRRPLEAATRSGVAAAEALLADARA